MAWFEDVFTQDYDRIYFPTFTEERNKREAGFIESTLGVPAGSEMLDLACGHGRHALLFAARGYRVTGIDLSERFIRKAQAEAARRELAVQFEVRDMRQLAYKNKFDGIYCYFSSFGYFSHRENVKVLEQVATDLKSGGRFLLESINRDWLLHRIEAQPRRWEEIEPGFLYLEDVSFNARTSRIHTRRIVLDGTERREYNFDMRIYSISELEELIESVGMKIDTALGNLDSSPFSVSSHRMIIVSEKS